MQVLPLGALIRTMTVIAMACCTTNLCPVASQHGIGCHSKIRPEDPELCHVVSDAMTRKCCSSRYLTYYKAYGK